MAVTPLAAEPSDAGNRRPSHRRRGRGPARPRDTARRLFLTFECPTADRLADGGLRYTRFHVTALCSPTRQALLTGRNHHSVGMGGTTEMATAAPGYNGFRPRGAAAIGQILQGNGCSTAAFGKWHQTPPSSTSSGTVWSTTRTWNNAGWNISSPP